MVCTENQTRLGLRQTHVFQFWTSSDLNTYIEAKGVSSLHYPLFNSFPISTPINWSSMASFPSNSASEHSLASAENSHPQTSSPSFMTRVAMRVSRSRWFTFLRRVFHYQNGPRSDLGSNPFNSSTWMMLELIALLVQITSTTLTLAISKSEKPIWPMRVWIAGYDIGCVLNLLLVCGRYYQLHVTQGGGLHISDLEQQRNNEESRYPLLFISTIFLSLSLAIGSTNKLEFIRYSLCECAENLPS